MRLRQQPSVLFALILAIGGVAPALGGCDRHEVSTTHLTAAELPMPASKSAAKDTTTGKPIADDAIAQVVTRRLRENPSLETVQVTVANGSCTLSGSVESILAKDSARRIPETLRGVRVVTDQIVVQPAALRSDEQLRADVASELRKNEPAAASTIEVGAKNGVVTLSGTASTWSEKLLVNERAKTVRGITGIDDQITVAPRADRTAMQLGGDVRRRIENDVWLDGTVFDVAVRDHDVTLKGVVGSVAEKERARNDAFMGGAASVNDDGLTVDWAARDEQRHGIIYTAHSDVEIALAVKEAFRLDPLLKTREPEVAITEGRIDLVGIAANAEAKRAAEIDALNTVGVWEVKNRMTIDPSAARSTSPVADSAPTRSPAELKSALEERLSWDATIGHDAVNVAVSPDGVATLSGTPDSWSEIRAAIADAKSSGAKTVVSRLEVRRRAAP